MYKKTYKSAKEDLAVEIFQLKKSGWTVAKTSNHSMMLTFSDSQKFQPYHRKKNRSGDKPKRSL